MLLALAPSAGARKIKRKRYAGHDSRGRLAGKRMITQRPAVVDRRARLCVPVSMMIVAPG